MGKLLSLKKRGGKSFTVVEVLMVVVIMSLFMIFSIPYFRESYEKIKFKSTVNNIISFLRLGQEEGISKKQLYKVEIFPEEGRMELIFKKEKENVLKIPSGIAIETNIKRLFFDELSGEITIVTIDDEKPPSETLVVKYPEKEKEVKIRIYTSGCIKPE